MSVPTGYVVAGAVGLAALLGGLALASSSSSGSSTPAPTPVPLVPIALTAGHRYQVTLTTGKVPGLPTLADVQSALNLANGSDALWIVSASMTVNQVVLIVDCLKTMTVSPTQLYGGYNSADVGGISVHVDDLGPTPVGGVKRPPGLPPPSPTPPAPPAPPAVGTTPVTDPAMVTYAQGVLSSLIALGTLAAGPVPLNGDPNDAATKAAVSAYQTFLFGSGAPGVAYGTLDWLTWGSLLVSLLVRTASGLPTDTPTSDPALTSTAQRALAVAVGRGVFSRLSYGLSDVNGDPNDATWLADLAEARRQIAATLGGSTAFAGPKGGGLDYYTLAFFLAAAYTPLMSVPFSKTGQLVEPATPVTAGDDVGVGAAALILMMANGLLTSTGPQIAHNGDPTDPGLVAAVAAFQATRADLKRRTVAGVLDYLTLAAAIARALPLFFPGITTSLDQAPGEKGGAFNPRRPEDVAGAQLALALIASPAFAGPPVPGLAGKWTSAMVDGNAGNPNWMSALALWQKATSTGQAFSYRTDGVLDWPSFAGLLVDAYLG